MKVEVFDGPAPEPRVSKERIKWPWKTMTQGQWALVPNDLYEKARASVASQQSYTRGLRITRHRVDDATWVFTRIDDGSDVA